MSASALAHDAEIERVPFADLSLQWKEIEDAARADLDTLFATSSFCLGPFVERFEAATADYLEVRHAIGVNSGTSALHLALTAADVRAGDKVLVPAHTFIATVWAVLYVGAVPVLCDVEEASGNIDVEDAERRLDRLVKAVIPVHLYGQPVNLDAVLALAERHGRHRKHIEVRIARKRPHQVLTPIAVTAEPNFDVSHSVSVAVFVPIT